MAQAGRQERKMYTTELGKSAPGKVQGLEDPEKLAAFEARVAADEFIEPKDWMPEAYRRTLTRQISQHAQIGRASCRERVGDPGGGGGQSAVVRMRRGSG